MRTRERLGMVLCNTVVALGGAAGTYGLVQWSMREPEPAVARVPVETPVASVPRTEGRLAFVQPGSLPHREPRAETPPLRPSLDLAAPVETAPSWSTETTREPAQTLPNATLLPSMRLPWLQGKPGTPARRYYTLKSRLAEIAPAASFRLAAKFEAAKVLWPPSEIALVAVKDQKVLELHARQRGTAWQLVHKYRVLAASGGAGPKLRQGDRQVPEGLYAIAFLNPNSAFHVSLRVNYPNAFDRQMAAKDGRKELGGDIMIHGKNLSAGCLAVGDEAAEELFVLAAQTGLTKVRLIIAPTDFREKGVPELPPGQPEWLPRLYTEVATAMAEFKAPPTATPQGGLLSFFVR